MDYEVYELINKKPELNIQALAKELKCSTTEVYRSISRLEDDGLIRMEKVENVLRVVSVKWYEFLTSEEIEEFKNMDF